MFLVRNIQIILIAAIFLLFIIPLATVFQVPVTESCLFLLFQAGIIVVPGLAITLLTSIRVPLVSLLLYSYLFGYAVNIVEYFGIKAVESFFPIQIIPISVFILSILCIYIKRKELLESYKETNKTSQLVPIIFTGILLFFNIFVYSLEYIDLTAATRDFVWWCHNSVALKLSFPPENAYLTGTGNLFYHYFSSIQIAFFSLISNIDVKCLCIPFYSIVKTIIMIGAVDYALNSLKLTDARIKTFGFILVLFTTGLEDQTPVTYFHHIFFLPFGFDIGYAFGIAYLATLIKQFYKNEFDLKLFIPTIIFWFVCVGAKAPIATVLIIVQALICLYWLIKKQFKLSFGYGLSILLLFLFVCYKFVGIGMVLDGTSSSWQMSLYPLLYYGENYVSAILCMIGRIIKASPTLLIMVILNSAVLTKMLVKSKRELNSNLLILILIFTSIIGIVLWLVINAGGYSEMYYAMAAFIPLYFIIAIIYSLLIKNKDIFNNIEIISYKTISIIAIIYGMVLFSFCATQRNGMIRTLSRNLKTKISFRENMEDIKPLLWLRDNSPVNSIVLADNFAIKDDNINYYYVLLTERRQYLEETDMLTYANVKLENEIERRKDFVNKIFAGDTTALKQLNKEGINYIVSTKSITPDFKPNRKYLELVISNNKYEVFRVK